MAVEQGQSNYVNPELFTETIHREGKRNVRLFDNEAYEEARDDDEKKHLHELGFATETEAVSKSTAPIAVK